MLRRGTRALAVGAPHGVVVAAVAPLLAGVRRRGFYDQVRKEREGSDVGPDEMFADFPKNPNPQKVPDMLHKGNREAVDSAEKLNVAFLLSLVALMVGLGFFLDPFNEDQYERPNKFVPVVEPIEKIPPSWAPRQ